VANRGTFRVESVIDLRVVKIKKKEPESDWRKNDEMESLAFMRIVLITSITSPNAL